jgi:hypothetical protein
MQPTLVGLHILRLLVLLIALTTAASDVTLTASPLAESMSLLTYCIIGQTRCTVCLPFITINSLYMFPALICSSSGGTVYKTVGIFFDCIMSAGY